LFYLEARSDNQAQNADSSTKSSTTLVTTARGAGVAVNSKTKQDTFMKMISAGGGL
jgi:hypothetical protein